MATSLHPLLLLSDSALPLGSFAFSSSLESFLAHASHNSNPHLQSHQRAPARELVFTFLQYSLLSVSTTVLPFVTAVYHTPESAANLDDELDASTLCPVAKRASVSQGRALVGVWEKSLVALCSDTELRSCVKEYKNAFRKPGEAQGHLPVAWGLVCRAAGLALEDVQYIFVLNHAKAVLSAAVRLGAIGPYESQKILAGEEIRRLLMEAVERGGRLRTDEVGQTVPAVDLWQGRHELLYSRVFNS
ncbi:UreF-domain-containing protein [Pyronema omphalodes]|nr:UreF-domain-containing protein [Pyronema omphalodes]